MRVLIVKASAFGDILHALPVIAVLQQQCPGIQIDWVVEEPFVELLEGNHSIERVIVISTKRWRRSLTQWGTYCEIRAAITMLRSVQYDLIIDLQGNMKSGIVTRLAKSLDSVGFGLSHLQERINALCTRRQITLPEGAYHITDQYLALVTAALDLPSVSSPQEGACLFPTPKHIHAAADILGDTTGLFVLAIHQGTTWQTKYWDVESWVALIKLFKERVSGIRIVLTCGSDSEIRMAEKTRSAVGDSVQIVKRVPIMTLAALYQQVTLVMGGDTGPLHLAAAVGTATCSLYRSSDGQRSGPRGKRHAIVQVPMDCAPCFKTSCPDDARCRAALTPQLVFDRAWLHVLTNNLVCKGVK